MSDGLTPAAVAWRDRGEEFQFRDRSIHVLRQPGDGIPILFLHGFPTSSFDWREVIDLLPDRALVAFDFLGFGLSDKPGDHNYTLAWQADLVEAIVAEYVDGGPVFVCAHDLGTSVGTELMARDREGELDFEIDGILLFNGSILVERANPTLAQKLLKGPVGPLAARLSNEAFFRRQFSSIFSGDHPVDPDYLSDCWSLMGHRGGNRIGHKLISYMEERTIYAERWHGAVADWDGYLSLIWGMQDPVAVPEILEGLVELRPGVPVTRLDDLGHYPQIEDPARFTDLLAGLVGVGAKP